MSGQAALHSSVNQLTVEAVSAAILVALVVALLVVVGYAVVVGALAWVLVLVVELLRLGWASLYVAALRVRRRLRRRSSRMAPVGLTGPPGAGLTP